ncbi:MAG: PP2C family protein-serine/threonine phosphatase [Roseovarius sp.]
MSIRRVLVVDDSRLQRRIVNAALSRLGLEVVEAASGTEALAICETVQPDLVISDWMMPGMNGLDLCRAFRALPREDYGYFILVTSKSEKEEVALGLGAGADDFLTKPINPGELRARIAAGDRIVRMQRALRAALNELQALYDSLDNDLIEAKKLQQSLIPERFRDFGPAQVSMLLRSAAHVGGDLVGVFPVSDTRLGLYAIDVSGHGVSSALMTARLAGYLSATSPEQNVALARGPAGHVPRPPHEVLADLNQMILGEIETDLYFTMLLADANLETGRVVMAQAGHPCPAVQRADGKVEIGGPGGLPVGLIEGARYEPFEVQLCPGDRLLLYSDGVDECADRQGRLLGEEGLRRILRELRQTGGMAFLESVVWKLADHAGRDEFDDDVSAVLLEIRPVGKAPG